MTKNEPSAGRYRHYKGDEYEVVAVGWNEREERVVIYRHAKVGQWYSRTVASWNSPTPKGEARFARVA